VQGSSLALSVGGERRELLSNGKKLLRATGKGSLEGRNEITCSVINSGGGEVPISLEREKTRGQQRKRNRYLGREKVRENLTVSSD